MTDLFPPQLWPVTLYADRYRGGYSGGRWLAASGPSSLLSTDAYGQDVAAATWWGDDNWPRIGRGETPEAALSDLARRWREAGEPHPYKDGQGAYPFHWVGPTNPKRGLMITGDPRNRAERRNRPR